MSLINAINRAKTLAQQLEHEQPSPLSSELKSELIKIESLASELIDNKNTPTSSQQRSPEIKSGCYVFADEKGFFCPHCYDNADQKIATKRMNSKLRVCPSCRSSIT